MGVRGSEVNATEAFYEGRRHGLAGEPLASLRFVIDRLPKNVKGAFLRGFVRGQLEHMNLYGCGELEKQEDKEDAADAKRN